MIIVIDDERTFLRTYAEDTLYLRTSQDALKWFTNSAIQFHCAPMGVDSNIHEIWLDHDLGELSEHDVPFVAEFLLLLSRADPDYLATTKFFIHSQNPVGADNLKRQLQRRFDVQVVPLPALNKVLDDPRGIANMTEAEMLKLFNEETNANMEDGETMYRRPLPDTNYPKFIEFRKKMLNQ